MTGKKKEDKEDEELTRLIKKGLVLHGSFSWLSKKKVARIKEAIKKEIQILIEKLKKESI